MACELSNAQPRDARFHSWGAAVRQLLAAGALICLSACSSVNMANHGGPAPDEVTGAAPVDPVQSEPLAPPGGAAPSTPQPGTAMGAGPVKVALILPLTQNGQPSNIGVSLKNAADLALAEAGNTDITLLVKDDASTPEGATAAAQAALSDNADLIIGPLYSANVRAVAQVVTAAHKPMIAFSTDASAAQPGVYLLSFLVETYVDRIVDYAVSKGKKSFAALIPNNEYGRIAEAEFQQVTARRGVRVMEIEHYQPQNMGAAVAKIAKLGNQIDALFIADQAAAMPAMAQALSANGLNSHKLQMLGTGLWNDARVLSLPALQGAWFAAPDNAGFTAFAARYRAKYGSDPTRISTLSYDAVSLAVALAHRPNPDHFAANVMTGHSGFNGADGVFRFETNGMNQRGLAIMQINNNVATTVEPSPHTLSASAM